MLKKTILLSCAVIALATVVLTQPTFAWNWPDADGCLACDQVCPVVLDKGVTKPLKRAQLYNWNRNYNHVQYGMPMALVVPPTATMQTNWGWGVSSSRVSRLDHQFGRNYPGAGAFGGPNRHTPRWPSDTNQFGVYHVRGPW